MIKKYPHPELLIDDAREWRAHVDFIAATQKKGKKYILANKKFFAWLFHNPFWKERSASLLRHALDGKFTSEIGSYPVPWRYGGKTIRGQFLINMMSHEEYRGRGVGGLLWKRAEDGAELSVVLGYNQNASVFVEGFGWTMMPILRRFIRFLDPRSCSRLIKCALVKEREPMPVFSGGYHWERVQRFGKEYDRFWNVIKKKYPITVERCSEYMNWRYVDHPIFSYDAFCLKRGKEVRACIVVRIEKVPGYRLGRIVDLISHDDAELETLAHTVEFCRKKKADLIDMFFTGDFHVKSFIKAGFHEAVKEPYSLVPKLFNPIDRKKMAINCAYHFSNAKMETALARNYKNWYLTKGDSDQDRPN